MGKGMFKALLVTLLLISLTAAASAAAISLVPSKTEVALGEQFTVDVYVSDGTAESVFVNFTFDPTKVSVVGDPQTYGVIYLL